jgi:Zn-dependent protease
MYDIVYSITTWILPALLAITVHEAAHGWVAWRLGDDTAKRLGRVTFNPLRHIDPFGTIVLPAILLLASGGRMMLGFAKPVPVDFSRLNSPRRDMVLVAAAGPGVNLTMAIAAAAVVSRLPLPGSEAGATTLWIAQDLINMVWINVLLAVFNMLPVPPLDGGRVAVGLLPDVLARPLSRVEPYGFFIILGVIFVLPLLGSTVGLDLAVVQWLVIAPAQWLSGMIVALVGPS